MTKRARVVAAVVAATLAAGIAGGGSFIFVNRHRQVSDGGVGTMGSARPLDGPAQSACDAIQQTPTDLYTDGQRMVYVAASGLSSTRTPTVKAAAQDLARWADAVVTAPSQDQARTAKVELFGAAVRFATACTEAGYGSG